MSEGVVALVPARSGSKGVPDKNIRLLGGRSLIEWSVAAALRASSVDRVIVSTDSEDYARLALQAGADAPFLRPLELASDDSSDMGFVVHALDWLADRGEEPDLVVHLRPTTPFRVPDRLDEAVALLRADGMATALRSVHEMSTTAYKSMEITVDGVLRQVGNQGTDLDMANGPRQGFPVTYLANGYVDVLSTAFIRSSNLLHGSHVLPFVTPLAFEVDTFDDFERLAYHLDRHPEVYDMLFR